MPKPKYQLFDPLDPEASAALETDIRRRGVMVPVEMDEKGEILDGHHRVEIAERLGVAYPTKVRRFDSEGEKKLHVFMLNIARRHLESHAWGAAFKKLLKIRGVERKAGRKAKNTNDGNADTVSGLASQLGVDERTARRRMAASEKYDALPKAAKKQVDAKEKTVTQAVREQKEAKKHALAELLSVSTPATPQGPFHCIVADPPWRYKCRANDTTHRGRVPYPTMSLSELMDLRIGRFAEKNSVLWLWTTNAFLQEAYQCVESWEFTPKTMLTWFKTDKSGKVRMGLGDWLRGATEHCILAVRGKPIVTLTNQTTGLLAQVREHSRKPDEFYRLVESLCPGTKLEMFSREKREGWTSWGAEVGKFEEQG